MKQLFITICLIVFYCASGFAQNDSERFQKIEIAKVAYITKRLNLSTTEAQKFFPIYNQYRSEMRKIVDQKRATDKKRRSRNELEFDSEILDCKKRYREKFKSAVSASKASQFFEVEREFREQLFKELENRSKQ